MGNKQSEKKTFSIIKTIPIVGDAYRVGRGIGYAIKGNKSEVKNSFHYKLSDINPLKRVKEFS